MTVLGSLLGLLASGYGYDTLLGNLDTERQSVLGETPASLSDITSGVSDAGKFIPWSMRTGGLGLGGMDGFGNIGLDLEADQLARSQGRGLLSDLFSEQALVGNPAANVYGGGAYDASTQAMQNAMQDYTQRESDIYGRIRAMQQPEEQRQMEQMQSGLFGSGRGGMMTDAYGGSPEEFAFGKAQAEARNAASLSAMQQAQTEMMNQGSLAQSFGGLGTQAFGLDNQTKQIMGALSGSMMDQSYQPYRELLAQMQPGLQSGQMMNTVAQNQAGLLAQLGLGGLTTGVNYSNIKGNALVGLLEALGAGASGLGDALS